MELSLRSCAVPRKGDKGLSEGREAPTVCCLEEPVDRRDRERRVVAGFPRAEDAVDHGVSLPSGRVGVCRAVPYGAHGHFSLNPNLFVRLDVRIAVRVERRLERATVLGPTADDIFPGQNGRHVLPRLIERIRLWMGLGQRMI